MAAQTLVTKSTLSKLAPDLIASLLGAVPAVAACLALALSSDLPLRSAVVGVIVGTGIVSLFAKHRFLYHSPAPSLMLPSILLVQEYGIAGLMVGVMIAGFIQIAAGLLKIG